ncbi:MAG TPA: hypothetical protein PLE16_08665 [Spirochaetota bacterium]|nr:hypothetical protein [Spirochaetota bacterium]HPM34655.1 hypothetical protein [Spirochaetota bacterium]
MVWGLWHGLFMIIERRTGISKSAGSRTKQAFCHFYVIIAFIIGWVIFRADTLSYAVAYIKNMFGMVSGHKILFDLPYYIDTIEIIAFVFGILCAFPLFRNILSVKPEKKLALAALNVFLIIIFILSAASIASSTYNPFIYFRF